MGMKLVDLEFWSDEVQNQVGRGVAVIRRRSWLEERMIVFRHKVAAWSWQGGNNFGLM